MIRSSERSAVRAIAFLVAMTCAMDASASEPSAADVESARALYVSGRELRDAGDLAGSLDKFRAAYALVPTPITALELGKANALSGKPLEAREVLLAVERMPRKPDESKKAQAARVEAEALAEQLKTVVPSLQIVIEGAPAMPDVYIDGVRVPPEALSVPRKVNPGRHLVSVRIASGELTQEVDVEPGATKRVAFDLAREPVSPSTVAPPSDPVRPVEAGSWHEAATTAGVLVGIGGAVVGGVTGSIALAKASSLDELCDGTRCPPAAHDDLSLVQTMATVSTVAFGVALVGGLVAVTSWWTAPRGSAALPSPRSTIAIHPVFGGVVGTFP